MSLQRLLGSDETVKPSQRPYAPTKRVSPPSSVLVPISRVELAQCQTALNPLRTRPAPQQQHPSRPPSLPPAPPSLPARPQPATGGVTGGPPASHKRPNREDGLDEHAAKRWRSAYDARSVAEHCAFAPRWRLRRKLTALFHPLPDNARPNTDRVARQDSPIIGLKSFNNWIKTVLIAKFARREDDVGPKVKVLDLGCGKGGDLQKWAKAGTDELVGIGASCKPSLPAVGGLTYRCPPDIAEVSVEQARSRWQSLRTRFPASFFALDCFEVRPPPPRSISTANLCIHRVQSKRSSLSRQSRDLSTLSRCNSACTTPSNPRRKCAGCSRTSRCTSSLAVSSSEPSRTRSSYCESGVVSAPVPVLI